MDLHGIGDFSRMSGLPVKTLRFYHEKGLLVPAAIEPESGKLRLSLSAVADQAERESYSQYVGGPERGGAPGGSSGGSMGTLADKLMQALHKKK